jgi:ABC-type sugar transport system ATPase subunit
MILIELKGVSVKHGSKYAVQNINLSIRKGQIVGIIGKSGSGKTTILRAIAGFQKNNEGIIKIKGINIQNIDPGERGVGYIFQNYTLFPHMNVYENIAFGLKVKKLHKTNIDVEVNEISRFLNISHLLKEYPYQLSGGEQQRVAIARSLILHPDILMFDESFSSLDYNLKIELLDQIRKINIATNTTIVYVTHDQADCFGLCDEIVFVENGHIIEISKAKDIINSPKTNELASFTGIYQVLDSHLIKNITSSNYQFLSNTKYYIRKNKLSLIRHDSQDLATTGIISGISLKGLYTVVKLKVKDQEIEFIIYQDEKIIVGDKATLYFNSSELIKI